jgi:hypothetical protein
MVPPIISIKNFRGVNLNGTPTQIDNSESPDMLNVTLDQFGQIDKRYGYTKVFSPTLGPGKVNGLYLFRKKDGTVIRLLAHGTSLYTWDTSGADPVSIYSSKADATTRFFTFGNYCYIMDGTNYLRYDGTTVTTVESAAYVPTLTIGRAPAGGGTPYENWNLIGTGFKDSFSGDGTTKTYQLSLTNLDATAVTATVGGVAKVETTDFTVNRTTGVVTFTVAPATGVANNVVITAYKTQAGYADRVKKCTGFEIYGGTNDTRVFLFGNPAYPNVLRRCGLQDPTYWPELAFANVGSDAGKITRLVKQFSRCNIIKEPTPNDTTIFSMSFEQDQNGAATFPIIPLNSSVGCTAPDSLQLIENAPTFLSPAGVYEIVGTNVSDERNVSRISDNVQSKLLAETGLDNAVSVDFDKKYIICVNGNCYVYDYRQQVWYLWDNIPASCFLEIDGTLFFGSDGDGTIYRVFKGTDAYPYADDGEAIRAFWKSKVFSFEDDEHTKLVEKVFFSLKPSAKASADLFYATDRTESGDAIAIPLLARVDLIDFTAMDFNNFSFMTSSLPQEVAAKIKAKKIVYFQVIIQNDRLDESMGILSVGIKVRTQREVKR